ncbi:MAG: response regulator [Alphaproteobacteria bacterium]|nr:response regulator [Alphaproteobacteria bacterium]
MAFKFEKLSVLVVEDTPPMQKLIASVLESIGVKRMNVAENGQRGFDMFCRDNHDIIISDWLMSPVDGLELVRLVRNEASSPNRLVPVIMLTGYNSLGRVMTARDAGVTEFLVKPFTAGDVAKRIAHVINKPRDYIDSAEYFGPDRRRHNDPNYKGPWRRESDKNNSDWQVG